MTPEPASLEMPQQDTIFAPASGAGVAGISVIRLSGPASDMVVSRLTQKALPPLRRATLRELRDEAGGLIDQAIVLRFAAGASYTGESSAEFHCHGGRAVVAAVLDVLAGQAGCRLAEPGEFTHRAFEAGRLDLAEIEALGDLLSAETELQRRQAVRGVSGALHRQAEAWRADLLRAAALIEATIDWADEDVPEAVGPEVAELLAGVRAGISRELSLSDGAERLREGFEVAILGAPNAGKSSLFNALAGREAAITSVRPGTTRDVLELRYDLAGLPVVFLDTAGLREADDEIEAIGIARATERAQAAALRLFLRSADAPPPAVEAALWQPGDLRIWTKADLGSGPGDIAISCLHGDGIGKLLERMKTDLAAQACGEGLVGHRRQRQALEDANDALVRAENALETAEAETIAEDLRAAFRGLERLIGKVGVEDVLGAVFAAFCLGK
ncbi:MAG TPA: tRNA uridine-5-carboxymethylaminomethyl(34) synthesis GTPase MnmE [Thermohalobaculum sp.]|nr:tRNA uridine-5-carboxymethylaminomethyl(34) synthesis GTPase MnmE [Thermohalobaculum sp.]